MKVGQIYCMGINWFMVMKEVINEERMSCIWPVKENVEHGWEVCEVWTENQGCGFWHDCFQTWTQEEMDKTLQRSHLVTVPLNLHKECFKHHPKQVTEE